MIITTEYWYPDKLGREVVCHDKIDTQTSDYFSLPRLMYYGFKQLFKEYWSYPQRNENIEIIKVTFSKSDTVSNDLDFFNSKLLDDNHFIFEGDGLFIKDKNDVTRSFMAFVE